MLVAYLSKPVMANGMDLLVRFCCNILILICLFLKDVIQETTMLGPQRKERATRFLISREDLAMHWTSSLFAGKTAVSLVKDIQRTSFNKRSKRLIEIFSCLEFLNLKWGWSCITKILFIVMTRQRIIYKLLEIFQMQRFAILGKFTICMIRKELYLI